MKMKGRLMAKIVYNGCHGGFSLSDEAIQEYAKRKGFAVYPWRDPRYDMPRFSATYFKSPLVGEPTKEQWSKDQFEDRELERHDPVLVEVVETLGARANGACAELRIEELPDGTLYRIDEYDGMESVETQSDIEWKIAQS